MSPRFVGPKAESYKPPGLGLLRLSKSCGFLICLTEIRRTSADDRKLKPILVAVVGIGCAGSAMLTVQLVTASQNLRACSVRYRQAKEATY